MGEVDYLNPDYIQHVENIVLKARVLVEGTLSGIHKSPHKGSSIEFLEHKQYSPGDEIRHIDWKLVARSDRFYVKQFEDETNLRAILVIDGSGSMNYGKGLENKLDYARSLALALSYMLLNQSDAVGILSQNSEGERIYIPPRSQFRHYQVIAESMQEIAGEGGNVWLEFLEEFCGNFHKRGMFIILSDLLVGGTERFEPVLKLLRAHSHDVIVLHILHNDEWEFPFSKLAYFCSLEDDRKILVEPNTIRKHYLKELNQFLTQLRSLCLELEATYVPVNTSDSPERAIASLLLARVKT